MNKVIEDFALSIEGKPQDETDIEELSKAWEVIREISRRGSDLSPDEFLVGKYAVAYVAGLFETDPVAQLAGTFGLSNQFNLLIGKTILLGMGIVVEEKLPHD